MSDHGGSVGTTPDQNPVKDHVDTSTHTGKSFTRANIPLLGGVVNVDTSHLWKKMARVTSTQFTPQNSRNNLLRLRGLLDIEIPSSQVHVPDTASLCFTLTNTASALAASGDQNNYRQVHLGPAWRLIEYMEELPNGGSPVNTYYTLDIREWLLDQPEDIVEKNGSLCHFVPTGVEQARSMTELWDTAVNTEIQKQSKPRYGDPTSAMTIWPSNINSFAGAAQQRRPFPNSVDIRMPICMPLFSGHCFWPAIGVRPRIRTYFNANDAILDVDSSRGVHPLQTATDAEEPNTRWGWQRSGWASYAEAREAVDIGNFELILSGLVFGGRAYRTMKEIYSAGFAFPVLTPQRMIINFTGAGTIDSPDDTSYQTLSTLQGLFAYVRYYLREQGSETNAGTFDDYWEIVRITTRDSGGRTLGYEKIPGEIMCFEREKRSGYKYATYTSEKINYHSNNPKFETKGNLFDPVADTTAVNNSLNGYPNSPGAPRILTDYYCDSVDLARQGINDGSENFDGDYTLQIAPGRGPNAPYEEPTGKQFTLHIHGQRYSTYVQGKNGKFHVRKH
jgi:hypothetical protein